MWRAIEQNDVEAMDRLSAEGAYLTGYVPFHGWRPVGTHSWVRRASRLTLACVLSRAVWANDVQTVLAVIAQSNLWTQAYEHALRYDRPDIVSALHESVGMGGGCVARALLGPHRDGVRETMLAYVKLHDPREVALYLSACCGVLQTPRLVTLLEVPGLISRLIESAGADVVIGTLARYADPERLRAYLVDASTWAVALCGAIRSNEPCERLDKLLPLFKQSAVQLEAAPDVMLEAVQRPELAAYAPLLDADLPISTAALEASIVGGMFWRLVPRASREALQGLANAVIADVAVLDFVRAVCQ